jgi:3-mercaptopyruvate sulfurtransferase SseA
MTPEGKVKSAFKRIAKQHRVAVISLWLVHLVGVPDTIVLLPGGRTVWIEFKKDRKTGLRREQGPSIRLLQRLGFRTEVVKDVETAKALASEFGAEYDKWRERGYYG